MKLTAEIAQSKRRLSWYENVGDVSTLIGPILIEHGGLVASSPIVVDENSDGVDDLFLELGSSVVLAVGPLNQPRLEFDVRNDMAVMSFVVGDIDRDNELDIVFSKRLDVIRWGDFGLNSTSTQLRDTPGIALADVDADGDLDVVAASFTSGRVMWFENRHPGDANGDGKFDSSDLVAVFQAGEFEDNVNGNSDASEGDWDGNGDFDSSDLVTAFQTGAYVSAVRVQRSPYIA